MVRIGHASISENKNSGRDGKAKAGDQTKKEVCIREYYAKGWKYLIRCKDRGKAEIMAKACESLCNNDCVGYDQLNRLSLNRELKKVNYDYTKLTEPCECDCSSFMTVCAQIAGIDIPYPGGNAPTTSNMVRIFDSTGQFDVRAINLKDDSGLMRGDILVGAPATHTVMVLDDAVPKHIQSRRTLKQGMSGSDVIYVQQILQEQLYDLGKWGVDSHYGEQTRKAVVQFQKDHGLVPDGIVGKNTWSMLERYA